jgi:hypothetical protein
MTEYPDLFSYICVSPPKSLVKEEYFPKEMTDEEVFSLMDAIIEEKYPHDDSYRVDDEEEPNPPIKKQKTCFEPEEEIIERIEENKQKEIESEEIEIRKKIDCIFKQMQIKQQKMNS